MITETGKPAVWQHAKETGLDEFVLKVASVFGGDAIADICIISTGKMTFIKDRPRKMIRVPAIPTRINFKAVIEETKKQSRKYK